MCANDMQHEALHNRLLRRADWRFLLPNPVPTKSVCFTDGLLAAAVECISQQVVDARSDATGECDLAVAVDPKQQTLQQAWIALRSGGSCYTEWYSPLAGGPQSIRRRMTKVGFQDVRCYWPWPPPARAAAQFWLPLEAPSALSYFIKSRPQPRSRGQRSARALLHAGWNVLHRGGLLWPICAIARKPGRINDQQRTSVNHQGTSDSSDVPNTGLVLSDIVRAGWSSWGRGSTPDQFAWLLLTGGRRSINKAVALVFADGDCHPQLAIKMPRVCESIPALKREATILEAVHAQHAGGVPGVPQVLFCHEQNGLVMLGETVLAGVPLYTQLRQDNYRNLALTATAWLANLAGRSKPCSRDTWWSRLIEPVLADFSESFGPLIDQGMLRETRDMLHTLGDLPLVCEQRDFSPWNVLLAPNGDLVVLDWESAELQGLPAMDLIYFLTYLSFFLDGAMESGHYRASYRAMLNLSMFTGRVMGECIMHYAKQLDLDPAIIGPLRLLAWMLHSRSEYQHFMADAGGRPEREMLQRSLFVGLWEEELRHATKR
jgi:hypothetical protein